MGQPTEGQIIQENELNSFQYPDGEPIVFKDEGNGIFSSETKEVPMGFDDKGNPTMSCRYVYTIVRNGQNQLVAHVVKQKLTPEFVAQEEANKKKAAKAAKEAKEAEEQAEKDAKKSKNK